MDLHQLVLTRQEEPYDAAYVRAIMEKIYAWASLFPLTSKIGKERIRWTDRELVKVVAVLYALLPAQEEALKFTMTMKECGRPHLGEALERWRKINFDRNRGVLRDAMWSFTERDKDQIIFYLKLMDPLQ